MSVVQGKGVFADDSYISVLSFILNDADPTQELFQLNFSCGILSSLAISSDFKFKLSGPAVGILQRGISHGWRRPEP